MPIQREKIGVQVKRILATRPNLDAATGMLYNKRAELTTKRHKVTLVGVFVSDENTFLIRPHLFESRDKKNAVQWSAWMREHYGEILRGDTVNGGGILPGMEVRTGKQWRLYRVIGILPNDSTGLVRAKIRKTRNKKK